MGHCINKNKKCTERCKESCRFWIASIAPDRPRIKRKQKINPTTGKPVSSFEKGLKEKIKEFRKNKDKNYKT